MDVKPSALNSALKKQYSHSVICDSCYDMEFELNPCWLSMSVQIFNAHFFFCLTTGLSSLLVLHVYL